MIHSDLLYDTLIGKNGFRLGRVPKQKPPENFQLLKDIICCLYEACGRKSLTLDPLFLQLLFEFFRVCEETFGAGVELGRGVFANDVGAKFDRLSRRKMTLRDDVGLFEGSKPDKLRFWKGIGKGCGDEAMLLHRPGWNLSIFRRPTHAMSEA